MSSCFFPTSASPSPSHSTVIINAIVKVKGKQGQERALAQEMARYSYSHFLPLSRQSEQNW
eukprot:c14079_g2_i1 orf=146-328(-)